MITSFRVFAILTTSLCLMLSNLPTANSQSDAEKIFGAIVKELERQSQKNNPRPQPNPGNPGPGQPFPVQPRPGNSGPKGNILINNESHDSLQVGFARPHGGGTYRKQVSAHNTYRRTGMAIGTMVNVSGPNSSQQFRLSGSNLSITVAEDGRMMAASSSVPPQIMPIMPVVPNRKGSLNISNLSLRSVSIQVVSPQGMGAFAEVIQPGRQWTRSNLAVDTEVTFAGQQQRSFRIKRGTNNVFISPDGTINISGSRVPSVPTPPSSNGNTIEIANRCGQPITATYGTRVREIQNRSGYTFVATPPGQIVRVTGNGATATFAHRGQIISIRVQPNGQFDNLPLDASVVPDGIGPGLPTPGNIGHALVLNQSSQSVMYRYQEPGSSLQNLPIGPMQTIEWRPVPAGTIMSLVIDTQTKSVSIKANQWTSMVVSPQGQIAINTTPVRIDPKTNPLLPTPSVTDLPIPTPGIVIPNPKPGPNESNLPQAAPRNLLATTYQPFTGPVLDSFASKTTTETKAVVEMLKTASTARIDAIDSSLNTNGINNDLLIDSAKRGKLEEVVEQIQNIPTAQATNSGKLLEDLTAIAALRSELVPLAAKLAAGASNASLLKRIKAISQQANRLGNQGLAAAMKSIRRDLTIQETLSQSVLTKRGPGSLSTQIPKGMVTVISHPWVEADKIYFDSNTLILKDSPDGFVSVSKEMAQEVLGLPIAKAGATQPAEITSVVGATITVTNPSSNDQTIQFDINQKTYTLTTGQQLELAAGSNYIIEFRPNNSGEKTKYNLSEPGIYLFSYRDKAWSLGKKSIIAQISNFTSNVTLNYLLDGIPQKVVPGKTAIHTSSKPMIIAFDSGNDTGTISRKLVESGEFYFALQPDYANKWDLFQGKYTKADQTNPEGLRFKRTSLVDIKNTAGKDLFDFTLLDLNEPSPATTDLIDALR